MTSSEPCGIPDTRVYYRDLPAPGPRPGPYRCGCDHSFGASCGYCRGDDADEREVRRNPALSAEVAAWTYDGWVEHMRAKARGKHGKEAAA